MCILFIFGIVLSLVDNARWPFDLQNRFSHTNRVFLKQTNKKLVDRIIHIYEYILLSRQITQNCSVFSFLFIAGTNSYENVCILVLELTNINQGVNPNGWALFQLANENVQLWFVYLRPTFNMVEQTGSQGKSRTDDRAKAEAFLLIYSSI